jgi:phosphate/sulfate permease
VNLGRQDAGSERFKPHFLSRFIVEASMEVSKFIIELLPNSWTKSAEKRLDKQAGQHVKGDAAFDLVRASANLMVASVLIALASSRKLPLSTTYVSFMVAMGTSLADQAWGRESAVYRVAGVLNVIGGWFMTAMTALVASGIAALLFFNYGLPAILILFALAAFLIIRSHTRFIKRKKATEEKENLEAAGAEDRRIMIDSSRKQLAKTIHELRKILRIGIREIPKENRRMVKKVASIAQDLFDNSRKRQKQSLKIYKEEDKDVNTVRLYLLLQNELQELEQTSLFLLNEISEFLSNKHEPPKGIPMDLLLESEKELTELLLMIESTINKSDPEIAPIEVHQSRFLENSDQRIEQLLGWAKENKSEQKKAVFLCVSLLMDSKNIADSALRIVKTCNMAT